MLSHIQISIRIYVHSVNTNNIKVRCLVDEMVFSGNELVFVENVTSYLHQINCEDVVTFKLKMTQKRVQHYSILGHGYRKILGFMSSSIITCKHGAKAIIIIQTTYTAPKIMYNRTARTTSVL